MYPVKLASARDTQIAPTVTLGLAQARLTALARIAIAPFQNPTLWHAPQHTTHRLAITAPFRARVSAYLKDLMRAGMGL